MKVVLPLLSIGRHGWRGDEYITIRKLKKGGYSVRAVYMGFSGYTRTVLKKSGLNDIREVFEHLDELYNSKVLMRLFLRRAGKGWAKEKELIKEVLEGKKGA